MPLDAAFRGWDYPHRRDQAARCGRSAVRWNDASLRRRSFTAQGLRRWFGGALRTAL